MACLGTMAVTVQAGVISPEQALGRLQTSTSAKKIASGSPGMRLVHTASAETAQAPAFYVFDKPAGGYVILSADDRLAVLLADVDEGCFDLNNLPDNTRWWLGEYTREIDYFLTHSAADEQTATQPEASKVRLKDKRNEISPLLTTKWAQQYPYNSLCPTINGRATVTGCVATATAQVVNYHRWPETNGFGNISYTTTAGRSYSYDFGATTFAWDDMIDSYSNSSTQAQKDAVATLMVACGMGVKMDYSTSESSAQSLEIPGALQTYFGFAESTSSAMRETYSTWEWEELIYQELAGGRPVNYSGVGTLGGHQFVADGYRADNLFHFNWGWGGMSDGYFRLSALNPESLGTGGGSGGFNTQQTAIVGCCPPDKAEGLTPVSPLYINGQMSVDNVSISGYFTTFKVIFENGGIFARVSKDYSGQFGMMMTDVHDNVIGTYGNTDLKFDAADNGSVSGFRSTYAQLPPTEAGTYRLYPVFKASGESWKRVPIYNGLSRFITLTIDENGQKTFEAGTLKNLPELEISDLIVPETIEAQDENLFTVEAYNGDALYDGEVRLFLCGDSEDEADVCVAYHDLKMSTDSNTTFTMPVTLDTSAGSHKIYFTDCLNRRISQDFDILVTNSTNSIALNGNDSEVVIYDLQGRRLPALPETPGVYIVRSGDKARKIVVTH